MVTAGIEYRQPALAVIRRCGTGRRNALGAPAAPFSQPPRDRVAASIRRLRAMVRMSTRSTNSRASARNGRCCRVVTIWLAVIRGAPRSRRRSRCISAARFAACRREPGRMTAPALSRAGCARANGDDRHLLVPFGGAGAACGAATDTFDSLLRYRGLIRMWTAPQRVPPAGSGRFRFSRLSRALTLDRHHRRGTSG